MTKKSKIWAYAVVVAVLLWAVYGKLSMVMTTNQKGDEGLVLSVIVKEIEPTTHTFELEVPGVIKPVGSLTLYAKTSGVISKITVNAGDMVASGTEIVVIDDHGTKSLLESAHETLEEKTKLYEIDKELSKMGYHSKTSYYQKRSELASAKANYEVSKANYEDTITYAPFDAFVGSVEPDIGEPVGTASPLATLFPVKQFKVSLYLSVNEISRITLGNNAKILLPDGKVVPAKVTKAEVIAEPSNKMYQVEVTANVDEKTPYPYGMLGSPARAMIETNPMTGIQVPGSSLSVSDAGSLGIKVVDDEGKVLFIPIKIEKAAKESFIVSNPELNDKILLIIRGADFIKNGDRVKYTKEEVGELQNNDDQGHARQAVA